ncbi:MAG TPA: class I mannose-6-phosphate isomerase [Gemmatimonadales bacterium]|nr:class I mannose-6-phosphate isomerase [Gemmatimonadales bacterium]
MHPFQLLPTFKERPWGVDDLSRWFTGAPPARIGEAWFTANDNRLAGGPTLGEAIAADPEGMLGPGARGDQCPLLVKLLFTSERLSVQVHPEDDYARTHHASLGKTEAWHVLEAQPGATLGLGFTQALGRQEAVEAARSGAIEHLLDWRATGEGDTWLVPARTVHAIGAGLTVVEVQENSDITYRLYDYGRPRELHLDRGFDVADLGPYAVDNTRRPLAPGRDLLTSCRYFTLERWTIDGALTFRPGERRYYLLIVTRGSGTLRGRALAPGQVWFVPAAAPPFDVAFDGTLLLAYTSETPTAAFRAAPR